MVPTRRGGRELVTMWWPVELKQRAQERVSEKGLTAWVIGLVEAGLDGQPSSPDSLRPSSAPRPVRGQKEPPTIEPIKQGPADGYLTPSTEMSQALEKDPWNEPARHKFEPKFGRPHECKHCGKGRKDREQH